MDDEEYLEDLRRQMVQGMALEVALERLVVEMEGIAPGAISRIFGPLTTLPEKDRHRLSDVAADVTEHLQFLRSSTEQRLRGDP